MRIRNNRCLVLNADYSVLGLVNWQKALVWSLDIENPKIEVIDFYKDDFIQGVGKRFAIPAVIKTLKYFRIYNQRVNFSRKNLFIRDDYSCQYCGNRFDIARLTYDHVIPKSSWKNKSGSPTNWTNIVTACVDCNRKKGNRTPKQANMPLLSLPIEPQKTNKYLPIVGALSKIKEDIPSEWSFYLPDSYL
jgi:5-methylcytosine-specific restriction endonuclease McrA